MKHRFFYAMTLFTLNATDDFKKRKFFSIYSLIL